MHLAHVRAESSVDHYEEVGSRASEPLQARGCKLFDLGRDLLALRDRQSKRVRDPR
jgi:hypothetical protein